MFLSEVLSTSLAMVSMCLTVLDKKVDSTPAPSVQPDSEDEDRPPSIDSQQTQEAQACTAAFLCSADDAGSGCPLQ